MKNICLLFMSLLLTNFFTACATFTNLDPYVQYDPLENESIVVLGVEPEMRIAINAGIMRDGSWYFKSFPSQAALVQPENGFIVIKLKPRVNGESYGVTSMHPGGPTSGFLVAKEGTLIPTFEVSQGNVLYVGTIILSRMSTGTGLRESQNLDAAHAYITKYYPQFAEHLSQGAMKFIPLSTGENKKEGLK